MNFELHKNLQDGGGHEDTQETPSVFLDDEARRVAQEQVDSAVTPFGFALNHVLDGTVAVSEKELSLIERAQESGGVDGFNDDIDKQRIARLAKQWWHVRDVHSREAQRKYAHEHYLEDDLQLASFVLEGELKGALAEDDPDARNEAIEAAKGRYLDTFTESHEMVELVFGFVDFLENNRTIAEMRKRGETVPGEHFREAAGYEGRFTDYLLSESDPNQLKLFWAGLQRIAQARSELATFVGFRSGVLTQAATHHLLESLGIRSRSATDVEDSAFAVDLWAEGDPDENRLPAAIQIKSGAKSRELQIITAEDVGIPSVLLGGKDAKGDPKITALNTPKFDMIHRSFVRAQDLAKKMGQTFESFYIEIPLELVDPITGRPDSNLVDQMREALEGVGYTSDSGQEQLMAT